MADSSTPAPQCTQCGRPLDSRAIQAGDSVCEQCHQREFASHAEQTALGGSQREFVLTNILVGLNVAVYLWMTFFRHVSPTSPTTDQVIYFGGNYGPLTLGTQPWRLLTSIFVHIGFVHLLANMWALYVLGRLAESLYGRWSYLTTYLLAGLAGSVASLLWNPMNVSAGASGAIFGVVGALITTFLVGKLPLPRHNIRFILITLIVFAGFDLIYGIWKSAENAPHPDNAAHIGGLVFGLIVGVLLGHHLGPSRHARVFRERLLVAAIVLVFAFGLFVWHRNGYVADVERARVLINKGAVDEGLRQLQIAANRRPDEPSVLLLMGEAYAKKGEFQKAEQAYRRITQVKPDNALGWNNLAQAYAAEQKFPESAAAWIKVAELSKKNGAFAWFNAGQTYSHIDKQDEAIKAFQKALKLAPTMSEAWGAMGYAQMKAGQNPQAVASLERAVKLEPANPDLRLLLGNAYLAVGKQEQAQEQFFESSKLRAALQQRMRQLLQQQRLQTTNPPVAR